MILKHISVALSIFTLLCDQHHHPSLKRLFSLCKAQRSELNSNVEMPHPYIFHIFEGGVNVCNCSHELLPICCHSQGKQIQRLSVGSLYNNDVVWTECIPQNHHVASLISNVMVFGGEVFGGEVFRR